MAKVLLMIPTEGSVHPVTHACATSLSQRADVDHGTAIGRPADYARNRIVRGFLTGNWTHLFFLDSDVGPPDDVLDRLLALDAPLASGCYHVLMRNGLRWAISNKDSDGRYRLLEELLSREVPFEADAGGAGCLLIRRDVFNKIEWPWFKWIETADGGQTSEDIFFFQKANAAGLRVSFDPKVICDHFKTINLRNLMRKKTKDRKE